MTDSPLREKTVSKQVKINQVEVAETSNSGPYTMTEDILTQRIENENTGRYITQLYAGIVASVSSISFGTMLGWSSPAIRTSIDNSIDVQAIETNIDISISWIASLGPLGCSLGILVWSYFNGRFGPKKTMIFQSPMLFLTWMTLAFVQDETIELMGRFFCGFFAISYRICGETLFNDSVHKLNLQHMIISYRSCVYLGVFLSYTLGVLMADDDFSLLNCTIVALHFFLLLYCPESPVFLYDRNLKKAEAALSWYRGPSNIYTEMRSIKKDSDIRKVDPAAYKYMLYSKVVVKAIAIVVVVNIMQTFSGYYIFLYYGVALVNKFSNIHMEMLKETSIDHNDDAINVEVDAIIFGLTMFVSSVISTWMHYRTTFGVKKPLVVSSSMVTVILTLMAIYFLLKDKKIAGIAGNNWIFFVLANALVIAHEIGLSCVGDIMLFDYTPNQVYPRARLIVKFTQWILSFVVINIYFNVTNVFKGAIVMGIFAAISLCGIIFAIVFVIECKDKTLVQVQTEIGGNPIGSRGVRNVRYQKKGAEPMIIE